MDQKLQTILCLKSDGVTVFFGVHAYRTAAGRLDHIVCGMDHYAVSHHAGGEGLIRRFLHGNHAAAHGSQKLMLHLRRCGNHFSASQTLSHVGRNGLHLRPVNHLDVGLAGADKAHGARLL